MEFGIFIQGYSPGPTRTTPTPSTGCCSRRSSSWSAPDRNNWKYVWISEHHALTEYSHISASEVVRGLPRRVHRAHPHRLGHLQPEPAREPPGAQRRAGRHARPPHATAASSSAPAAAPAPTRSRTFNIHDPASTKREWDEVLPEIVRMWEQKDYTFQGKHFALDTPHNILPKPYGPGHPPIWVACGSPATFAQGGRARHRRARLQLLADHRHGRRSSTPTRRAIADCTNPVGQFVNDNVMLTNAVRCFADRDKAREIAHAPGLPHLAGVACTTTPSPKPAGAVA